MLRSPPLPQLINAHMNSEMTKVFNKHAWPALVLFIYLEKVNLRDELTMADFRAIYSTSTIYYNLKMLMTATPDIIKRKSVLGEKDVFVLTEHGRKVGNMMWNYLNFLSEYQGRSLKEHINKMNAMRDIVNVEGVDEEELEIEKHDEMVRLAKEKKEAEAKLKAGVVDNSIDLNRIEVK